MAAKLTIHGRKMLGHGCEGGVGTGSCVCVIRTMAYLQCIPPNHCIQSNIIFVCLVVLWPLSQTSFLQTKNAYSCTENPQHRLFKYTNGVGWYLMHIKDAELVLYFYLIFTSYPQVSPSMIIVYLFHTP